MNKDNAVLPDDGILFSLEKEGILTPATIWMDLRGIMFSELA